VRTQSEGCWPLGGSLPNLLSVPLGYPLTQRTVALSSTEAEYMVLSDCSCQCIWIHSLLNKLGYNFGAIHVNGDNQGSIFMAKNPVTESQNKHINMCFHAICDFIAQGKVKLFYIEGSVIFQKYDNYVIYLS